MASPHGSPPTLGQQSGSRAERLDEVADRSKQPTGPDGRPERYDRRTAAGRAVSVILPTYNEATNVPILVARLQELLIDLDYEIIIVDDDSPDRTWEVAGELAKTSSRILSVRRINERGLSSAVLSGMHLARGRVLAVMDADLQHDETALLDLIGPILDGEADVVVGSREAEGGSYGQWNRWRRFVSWGGKQLAQRLLGTQVSDPMSGFFAVSHERFERVENEVNPRGFKILLEFLARGSTPRVSEVGYRFRNRIHGTTKMSGSVAGSYLLALLDLFLGRIVSATFTAYALVGLVGVVVRLASLVLLTTLGYGQAGLLAFEISVLANYWLNNRFTFAPLARRGRRFVSGLVPFHLIALHGLMVQVGIASTLGAESSGILQNAWWIQVLGIGIATTGNFIGNRSITWRASAHR